MNMRNNENTVQVLHNAQSIPPQLLLHSLVHHTKASVMKQEVECCPLPIHRRPPFSPQHVPSLTIHPGDLRERERYIGFGEGGTRTVKAR
jgi:hypothetical protein